MAADNIVEIEDLHFAYNRHEIFKGLSLKIPRGKVVAILGASGCGKTTLLKLILGLLAPREGRISVFGKPPAQARQRLGYVPQFATFERTFPISVRDTVLQGRLGQTWPVFGYRAVDREVAERALTQADILDLQHRPLAELSGGQRQRVLIARALASDPEVLILDEPTANIDPRVEAGVFELLKRLNERVTVIVVSHDIGFISKYITRVACLNRRLVCHTTSMIDSDLIQELYGTPMQMVHHHTVIKEDSRP